jgi:UDP-N-acetylglucosamine--N-acetylmuramyl-(pentapeptide) pyrophosphoryl-undecaprenol N-acetylglucosamine transferase
VISRDQPWAILAGGGTAGHVLPAIAVADALVARGHQSTALHFVGSARGIEARLVPEAGYSLTLLAGRGIQRRLTVENLRSALGLIGAVTAMVWRFRRRRPAVVFSVGGYASVPCAVAAALWRVPLVLGESNARAGASNRLVAKRARASAVAFHNTGLPRAQLTGNPVRPAVQLLADPEHRRSVRITTREQLGIAPVAQLVVVFGGSLGGRRLNEAAISAAEQWSGRAGLVLYLITGERDAEFGRSAQADWLERHPDAALVWLITAYEHDMPSMLAAADLVVSRAGGSSVADAAVAGLPCILVPLPIAAEDHQTANANAVVADGAAVVVADGELDGGRLVAEVDAILGDPLRAQAMATAALRRGRPDAADAIAALIEQHGAYKDSSQSSAGIPRDWNHVNDPTEPA